MKKAVGVLLVVGIVAAGGWRIYQRLSAGGKNESRRGRRAVVAVEVSPVGRATVRDIGVFTGTLRPNSEFIVAPKITGRLEKLLVDIGDTVRRDQLIAELDDEEYRLHVEQAQAELDVAKANVEDCTSALEVAKREFARVEELRKKKIASESELDAVQAQYNTSQAKRKVALAQVEQRQAALRTAEIRVSYAKVRATWATGDTPRVIGERFVDEGALLKANEPIVSVVDDHFLKATVHVIERDYPKVRPGQEARVRTDAYPGEAFAGQIVRIAPVLKESSRQGLLEIEVPNPKRLLKPGMWISVEIEFGRHEGATVVPFGALAKRDDKRGVFLADVEAGTARFVPVSVGIVQGALVEVTDPPLSGLVVTLGHHLLEDGAAITLPGERAKDGAGPAPSDSRPAEGSGRPRSGEPK
jgi:RND family efflux transporter MFP subunit